jgi:hypothetical protein
MCRRAISLMPALPEKDFGKWNQGRRIGSSARPPWSRAFVAACGLLILACGENGREVAEGRPINPPLDAGASLAPFFERVGTLHVSPIEYFRRVPTSLVALPDGKLVLVETEGAWLHVVGPDGQGITRLGGEREGEAGSPDGDAGKFHSLSSLALAADGRLLAADRMSPIVSVFSPSFEPESTFSVPGARSIWQLEHVTNGRIAAAVAPVHPTAGGQVLLLQGPLVLQSLFPQDPIFRHNRWDVISSARVEVLDDQRIVAHWAPLPWAKLISAQGDSLGTIGKPSLLYRVPSSGPSRNTTLEGLRAWYGSFTPLVNVEAVGSMVVFQFLAPDSSPRGQLPGFEEKGPDRSTHEGFAIDVAARQSFVNLYSADGDPIARDLMLPAGSRVLDSNDRTRLYLLTNASPGELRIETWRPKPQPLSVRRIPAAADK